MAVNALSPRAFVKWAGGKQALAALIAARVPSCRTYHEPFLGGGSVFLSLGPSSAVLGDANTWLVDTYRAIRDDWRAVAAVLDDLRNTKAEFHRIRAVRPEALPLVERAAQFIYLNKTCFRGLFRVNQRGQFNVPYGAYERRYYESENLELVARALEKVTLRTGDFELVIHDVTSEDFIYFDPPYYKFGGYSDFNRYTPSQFRTADHFRLAAVCRELNTRGVRWLLSNSDTEFVRSLYAGFQITQLEARREINLNARARGITELLICNFE